MRVITLSPACLLILLAAIPASASYTDEPYLIRLLFTLDRQNNSASGLGRQASLAFTNGASTNPAARGWNNPPEYISSVNYIDAHSKSGARIIALPLSITINKPTIGSFFGAYAHTETLNESGNLGLDQSMESDEFWLSYSRHLSNNTSLGMQIKYTDAEINHEFINDYWGGQTGRTQTSLHGYDFSFGLLTRFNSSWYAAFSGNYGTGSTKNKLKNVNALFDPINNRIIPPGMTLLSFNDDFDQSALRAGLGFKPNEHFGLYADFHQIYINSDEVGSTDTRRVELGFEYQIEKFKYRGGLSADTNSQISRSIGFSYNFNTDVSPVIMDIGYQWNTSPEVRPEFGRFDILSASVTMSF